MLADLTSSHVVYIMQFHKQLNNVFVHAQNESLSLAKGGAISCMLHSLLSRVYSAVLKGGAKRVEREGRGNLL